MHAQEVDLSHGNLLTTDNIMDGNAGNETKKLILLAASDTEQPLFVVAWGSQSPFKEGDGVVEAEHVVIIFNIVLSQQVIDFFCLSIVINVNIRPIVACRKGIWLWFNVSNCFRHINGLIIHGLVNFIVSLGDRLRVPEIMHIIKRLQVIDMLQNLVVTFVYLLQVSKHFLDFTLIRRLISCQSSQLLFKVSGQLNIELFFNINNWILLLSDQC